MNTTENEHTTPHKHGVAVLLGALGVVFGDIGTSPLYALQTVFSTDHNAVAATTEDVYGVLSLVVWSITIVVSIKYIALVMRADNNGEGGILTLTALLRRIYRKPRHIYTATLLGILGAALFYGDSLITPAISVMSAVEGLAVIDPTAETLVVPLALIILTILFALQHKGTHVVGKAFGPVMMLWFLTIAALGIPHIFTHPAVLQGLSPTWAIHFALDRPAVAFIALGAAVLTITGAEALYADMGHFGASPIRKAWFFIVFPCLLLNYLGQCALILTNPAAIDSPFFHLVPTPLLIPVVILATAATVIASQAVISGAFSVSQQALNLGLLPHFAIRHTSREEGGQIYVPIINTTLAIGVAILILSFRSSAALANAYGLAVTGTLILTTVLFTMLAHHCWNWPTWVIAPITTLIGSLELLYFTANLTKIIHGGWLPIVIATIILIIMTTWMRGARLANKRRASLETNLLTWLEKISDKGIPRVPGQAIYLHHNLETVPLALKENLRFNHVLHENIAIVTVETTNIPHVRHNDRVTVTDIGTEDDGIVTIRIRLGFNDSRDVPHNLAWSAGKDPHFTYDADEARYFLSVLHIHPDHNCNKLTRIRRGLFIFLNRNAGSRAEAFHLPPHRTAILGGSMYL
ncbi:potassium transport protein Kup [Dermatophilus congolensis]|uniref:Probable potassium transport system protein Kup n=1 Tax=Dermatophilus congolensis TaxID=1863 RepID=A0A239V9W7_9MICO|nr:potassium transporter Kup [Dermatophilus congolensis]SNV19001.1 potassium transport protein Kup [Dermatophilus congolensis]